MRHMSHKIRWVLGHVYVCVCAICMCCSLLNKNTICTMLLLAKYMSISIHSHLYFNNNYLKGKQGQNITYQRSRFRKDDSMIIHCHFVFNLYIFYSHQCTSGDFIKKEAGDNLKNMKNHLFKIIAKQEASCSMSYFK